MLERSISTLASFERQLVHPSDLAVVNAEPERPDVHAAGLPVRDLRSYAHGYPIRYRAATKRTGGEWFPTHRQRLPGAFT